MYSTSVPNDWKCASTSCVSSITKPKRSSTAIDISMKSRESSPSDPSIPLGNTVARVISETSEIPIEEISPDAHAIDDLGIDSLDFLDIVFALDKKFGIKIPLEAWTQEVNEGRASVEDYFVLKNLSARIDELVAAKRG